MLKRGVIARYNGNVAMNYYYMSMIMNGNATVQILNAFTDMVPDVTLNRESLHLYRTTTHELAHASHFAKAGLNYWNTYASYIVTCYMDGEGLYGRAGLPNSGVCGVGEMWGYYIGGMLASQYYGENRFSGNDEWFSPQIFRQLTGVRPVPDLHPVTGNNFTVLNNPLTEKQIFDCLTSDVRSHEQLRNRLIQHYGREQEITAVFADFGF